MGSSSRAGTAAPVLGFERPGSLSTLDASALSARTGYDGVLVDGGDLSDVDLTASSFTECELIGLTLTDAQLRGARFVDSLVVSSFAPSLSAARTTWRRCEVESPRWGSAELFDAEFDSVRISGGKIDFLNLRGAKLINLLIENCTITELDLGGATLDRVALSNCRIETLDVTRAGCTSFDLRTSEFSRINGIDGLRGATIDDYQLSAFASAFADHLGVRVE